MAEQEIVNSPAAVGESTPQVSGKSSADILGMINQPAQPSVNPNNAAGSQPAEQKPVGQKPEETKQPTPFDELDKVPDKFKNPDGTLDVKRLLGSYLEAEKGLSKLSNVSHETKQVQTEAEMYKQAAAEFKTELDALKQQINQNKIEGNKPKYTEEDIKLLEEDPEKWVDKKLEEKLAQREQKILEKTKEQNYKNYEMMAAINQARQNLPNFKDFEQDIKKKFEDGIVNEDPRAFDELYYAQVGRHDEPLVNYAAEKAYKQGCEDTKKNLKMQ